MIKTNVNGGLKGSAAYTTKAYVLSALDEGRIHAIARRATQESCDVSAVEQDCRDLQEIIGHMRMMAACEELNGSPNWALRSRIEETARLHKRLESGDGVE